MIQILGYDESQVSPGNIRGYVYEDKVLDTDLNRPLIDLYSNDSTIVSSLAASVISSKIFTNTIDGTDSTITFHNKVIIEGDLSILGVGIDIKTTNTVVKDNIIDISYSSLLSANGKGGLSIKTAIDASSLFYFDNALDRWNIEASTVHTKEAKIPSVTFDTSLNDYIDLKSGITPGTVPSGRVTLFVNNNNFLSFKDTSGLTFNIKDNFHPGFYDYYIENQTEFDAISSLSTSPKNFFLYNGSYDLNASFIMKDGIGIYGESKDSCIIHLGDSAIFKTQPNVYGFTLDNLTLSYVSPNRLINYSLFDLTSSLHCNITPVLENVDASAVFYGVNMKYNTLGNVYKASGIAFDGLTYCSINGINKSSLTTFNNCEECLVDTIVDSDQLFGYGDFNLTTRTEPMVDIDGNVITGSFVEGELPLEMVYPVL